MTYVRYAAAIVLVSLVQLSFISASSWTRIYVHPVLIGMVILTFLTTYERALTWALVGGLLLDTAKRTPYGTESLLLAVTAMGTYFIFRHYVTNRSFASLITLLASATGLYVLMTSVLTWVLSWSGRAPVVDIRTIGMTLLWSLMVNTVLGTVTTWSINRFVPSLSLHRVSPVHR